MGDGVARDWRRVLWLPLDAAVAIAVVAACRRVEPQRMDDDDRGGADGVGGVDGAVRRQPLQLPQLQRELQQPSYCWTGETGG